MINYMQNNVNNNYIETITEELYNNIFKINITKSFNKFTEIIYNSSKKLQIDYRIILKKYIGFIILNKKKYVEEKNINYDLQFLYNNTNNNNSINYLYYLLSNK